MERVCTKSRSQDRNKRLWSCAGAVCQAGISCRQQFAFFFRSFLRRNIQNSCSQCFEMSERTLSPGRIDLSTSPLVPPCAASPPPVALTLFWLFRVFDSKCFQAQELGCQFVARYNHKFVIYQRVVSRTCLA